VLQSTIGQTIDSILIQTDWSDTTKNETIEDFLDNYYEGIDFEYMETDYFYGQVIPYSNIARYSGDSLDSVVTKESFRQIYFEMYNSQTTNHSMIEIHDLEEQLKQYVIENKEIPMVVLDLNFEELDLTAFDNGLLEMLTVGEGIKTTGNGSPFVKKHVFVSFPYWGNVDEDLPVVFVEDFFVSNNPDWELDFQSLELITNGKNSTLETIYKSDLGVISNVKSNTNNASFTYTKNLKAVFSCSIDDPEEVVNFFGDCDLGIWYGCRHDVTGGIRNPVLIVEGFDPSNNRHLTCSDIIADDDISKDVTANYTVADILENHLYNVANDLDLADKLRANGYDVIIIDFEDGTGEMTNNAMVVVDVINWVNANKVADGEIVIIGPSMGGVLARYALAYMEENNMEHQTKLFLSFDAPQQGANVCLGLQHIGNFALNTGNFYSLGQIEALQNFRNEILGAFATKQLLKYHESAHDNFNLKANPNGMHLTFYDAMRNLNPPHNGYPAKCRNIAIANGSASGTNASSIQNGENLLTTFRETFPIPYVGSFRIYLRYNALPSHTFKSIAQGVMGYRPFLPLVPFTPPVPSPIVLPLNIHSTIVDNTDPLDNLPAGTQIFHMGLNGVLTTPNWLISNIVLKNDQNVDAFIHVNSALDIKGNPSLKYDIASTFGASNGNPQRANSYLFLDDVVTPFDEIYINNSNDPHVIGSLAGDPNSGDWAFGELAPEELKLQNKTVAYDTRHEANISIDAGHNVTSQILPGDYKLSANTHTDFVAGESINFKPGFDSNVGSMHAYIDRSPCYGKSMADNTSGSDQESSSANIGSVDLFELITRDNVKEITLYPNPTKSIFTIESKGRNGDDETKITNVEISNLQGQVVQVINRNAYKLNVDVVSWEKGIYLCKITLQNGEVKTERIIVQ